MILRSSLTSTSRADRSSARVQTASLLQLTVCNRKRSRVTSPRQRGASSGVYPELRTRVVAVLGCFELLWSSSPYNFRYGFDLAEYEHKTKILLSPH